MNVHWLYRELRYGRRLSDRILAAFDAACNAGDFQVAEQLLHVLKMTLGRPPPGNGRDRRSEATKLTTAYERLALLRQPSAEAENIPRRGQQHG